MILVVDNYDSFVFNLARYLARLQCEVHVVRNDAIDVAAARALRPRALVLSPGPCAPREAGCSVELVRAFVDELPILGICLGHQAIAEALGARIVRSTHPRHGRSSRVFHEGAAPFLGLPNPFAAGRYHSLAVDEASLPECLQVTARADDGTVMGIVHRSRPVVGLQFHPESILTPCGYELLANFLAMAGIVTAPSEPLAADELALPLRREPAPGVPVTY